jgi:curved DNA-binding protein CbpA
MKDYYAILGIPPDSEPEDIKSAYRNLVQQHHPDLNPDDADATERFLEIKEAYETLSDESLRETYDAEYVETFPGYEIEVEGEVPYWEVNPPAAMPVVHEDGSNALLRIFMVLLLPVLAGGLVMHFSGNVTATLLSAAGGLAAAFWLGSLLKEE